MVDTNIGRQPGVAFAVWRDVNESSGATPIFVRGVGVENLGNDLLRDCCIEQSAFCSCYPVDLGQIGERKDISGKENRRRWLCVARRLREPVIKAAASRASNMGKHTIKCDPSLLIGIEPLIEEIAKETAVLGDSLTVDADCGGDRVRAVLGVGSKVAHRGEAESSDDGIFHNVNVFVNLADLETALEVDVTVARLEFAVDHVRELPLGARDESAFRSA